MAEGAGRSRPAWLQQYELMGKIGEGTYGLVFLARTKLPPKRFIAIKKFKQSKDGDGISPTAIREIMLLREISHENVVKLVNVHINQMDMSLYLAFDYAEHDLYEIIRHHREKLNHQISQYTVKTFLWQLLNGLTYLHSNWIIHRDLKPSNILVMGEGDEHGIIKIADFGLARIYHAPLKPLSENGVVVTIWYRAPELLLGAKHYTSAVGILRQKMREPVFYLLYLFICFESNGRSPEINDPLLPVRQKMLNLWLIVTKDHHQRFLESSVPQKWLAVSSPAG